MVSHGPHYSFHPFSQWVGQTRSLSHLFAPSKALSQALSPQSLPGPDLFKFHIVSMPQVEGLPAGVETSADIEINPFNPLAVAFQAMSTEVNAFLCSLKPDIVFFDFAHWIPQLAAEVGFKTVCYNIVCASFLAITIVPARHFPRERPLTGQELLEPPKGYPSSTVVPRCHEAYALGDISLACGSTTFDVVMSTAMHGCDAIGARTCRELEGPMCDYLSEQYNKPVILSGPVFPESPKGMLDEKWGTWLSKFKPKSVVYCAFGSERSLTKEQIQELVLGFEMIGSPFFIALSKPKGANSIEEALPKGFLERVGDRGVVYRGWVQQTHILKHPSVGCFVSHCGFGSMWESLLSDNQIVLVPWVSDQIFNTRLLVEELKVAVEVERGEMGWFSKKVLCKAVKSVIDEDSEVGNLVKFNHKKWKETFTSHGFLDNYMGNFVEQLYKLKV